MRELICFCLLLLFAAVFPLCWATIDNGEMYVKSAGISLFVGMILSSILNHLIKNTGFHFPTKCPKKFRDKLTPIYKIRQEASIFYIEKWEIQNRAVEVDFGGYATFPFIALFKEWGYVNVMTVQEEHLALENIENLADVFKFLAEKEDLKKLRKLEAKEKKNEPINRLNKPFKDNYI